MKHQRIRQQQPREQRLSALSQTPEAHALEFVGAHDGQPLERMVFSETRFQHNFGDVRVHADAESARVAQSVNARAFTVGQDIVFNSNEFQPGTPEGRFILMHELAHTAQHRQFGNHALESVSRESDEAETEANAFAHGALTGAPVPISAAPSAAISTFSPWWMPPQMAGVHGEEKEKKDEGGEVAAKGIEYAKGGLEFGDMLHGASGMTKFFGSQAPGLSTVSRFGSTALEAATGEESMMGGLGKTFGALGGLTNSALGIQQLINGEWREGGVKTGRGVLDTASALTGGKTSGALGLLSSGVGLVDGIDKMRSDDLEVATGGAQETLQSGFGAIGSLGDMIPGGPGMILKAIGKPGEIGAKIGEKLVGWSDSYGKEHGSFGKNKIGENRTGSEEAADTGRDVQEAVSEYLPDWMGDVAGAEAAIAKSWYNAGESGVNWAGGKLSDGAGAVKDGASWVGGQAVNAGAAAWNAGGKAVDYVKDNVTLDPDEIDWGRTFNPLDW